MMSHLSTDELAQGVREINHALAYDKLGPDECDHLNKRKQLLTNEFNRRDKLPEV